MIKESSDGRRKSTKVVKLQPLKCEYIKHFIADMKLLLPPELIISVEKAAVTLEGPRSIVDESHVCMSLSLDVL